MMHREESAYQNLLRDYVCLLLEDAREAKARYDKSRGIPDEDFCSGESLAYYKVIDSLQHQTEAFGISIEEIGLDKINPDKDLIN